MVRTAQGFYELTPFGSGGVWIGANDGGNAAYWGDINASDSQNWDSQETPDGAGLVAVFSNSDANLDGREIELTGVITIGGILFSSTSQNYSLVGTDLRFQGHPTIAAIPAYIQMYDANSVTIANSAVWLDSGLDIDHYGTGTLFFNSQISGANGIVKDGPGAMALNETNAFTAGFTLLDGPVLIGNDAAFGTGMLTLQGGELVAAGAERELANSFTLGPGTVATSGDTLTLAGAGVVTGAAGVDTDNTLVISGSLRGSGALAKSGTGTLLLTSTANSFTGGLTLRDGLAGIAAPASIGTGTLAFDGGASLRYDNEAGAMAIANNIALLSETGTILGGGTLSGVMSGPGNIALTGGYTALTGSNTYTGTTFVAGGTVSIGAGGATGRLVGDAVLGGAPSELRFNTTTSFTYAGVVSGEGNLVKDNANTLTLTGSSSHTGATIINAGVLQVGDGGANGYLSVINGGTDVIQTTAPAAAFALNRSDAVTLTGSITGPGQFIQNGSGLVDILTRNNYTGGTIINSGTVRVSSTSGAGPVNSTVDVTDAGTFIIGTGTWNSSSYSLLYTLFGAEGGRAVIDIGSTRLFHFGIDDEAVLANGANFAGELVMRSGRYDVDMDWQHFLQGGADFRTEAGSYGTVSTDAPVWTMPGGLTFAGGTMAWTFDAANLTSTIYAGGPITIDSGATTTFQMTLQNTLHAPSVGDQTGVSLFAQDTGGATLLLAQSGVMVGGAYNNADLRIWVTGLGWQPSQAVRQVINEHAGTGDAVALGTFDWTLYGVAGDPLNINSTDLTVGYKLMKLEIYKDMTLDVMRMADDGREFSVALLDMGTTGNPSLDGMGSVRYIDNSDAQTGILLSGVNTYTGTSFVDSGAVVAGADGALGKTARLIVSATGAFDLNGKNQAVGALYTTEGGRVDLNGGVLTIT
ncbi:MAG: autotransporter-associated beta strand repeat-containing protein, partial [Micrococcales bacterium]|nr:autotransporter-associated beta strand repeat-containing protein [Micrococcales bacterium]